MSSFLYKITQQVSGKVRNEIQAFAVGPVFTTLCVAPSHYNPLSSATQASGLEQQ